MAGLPWMRVDTNLPTHDKVLELVGVGARGKAAAFVYVCGLAYSVGHGTDGFVRRAALPFIHGTTGDVRLLVDARLWIPVDGGWAIANFGTRQVAAASSQALSDVRAEAGRKGAAKRWGDNDKPA